MKKQKKNCDLETNQWIDAAVALSFAIVAAEKYGTPNDPEGELTDDIKVIGSWNP